MKRAEIIKLLNRAVIGVTSPNDLEHTELETLIDDLKAGSVMLQQTANFEALNEHLPQRKEPIAAVHLAWFGNQPSAEIMAELKPYTDAIVDRGGQIWVVPTGAVINDAMITEQLKDVGKNSYVVVMVSGEPGGPASTNAQILLSKLDLGKISHYINYDLSDVSLEKIVPILDSALRRIPGVPDKEPQDSNLSDVLSGLSMIQNHLDRIECRQISGQALGAMVTTMDQTRGWNPPGGSAWDRGQGQAGFLNPGMMRPRVSMFADSIRPRHDAYGNWADKRFGMPNQNQPGYMPHHDPYPARGAMARKRVQIVRLYPMLSAASKLMRFMEVAERGLAAINSHPAAQSIHVFEFFDPSHSLHEPVYSFGKSLINPTWSIDPTSPVLVVMPNAVDQSVHSQAQLIAGEISTHVGKCIPSMISLDDFIASVNEIIAPFFGKITPDEY